MAAQPAMDSAPSHARSARTRLRPEQADREGEQDARRPSSRRRPERTGSSGRRAIALRCRSGRRPGRADICYIRRRLARNSARLGTASATIAELAADPLAQLVAGARHVEIVGDQPDRADAAALDPARHLVGVGAGVERFPAERRRSRRCRLRIDLIGRGQLVRADGPRRRRRSASAARGPARSGRSRARAGHCRRSGRRSRRCARRRPAWAASPRTAA